MTSILSAISGQFTRALILGMFFPALLFIVCGLAAIQPLGAISIPLLRSLQALDKEWLVVAVSFITILLTGLLYNLSNCAQ